MFLNNLSRISSQIIEECNTQVGKMKQMEELIKINGMLEFDKLKVSYWLMLYINDINCSYSGIKNDETTSENAFVLNFFK